MLRNLDPTTRRAVLAHEQTHLTERHDLHRLAAVVAAAVNPFLCRAPAALDLACERQADEVAARTVGDRRSVVRAITTAVQPQVASLGWAATGADVPLRVAALLAPPDDNRMATRALAAATVGAVAVSAASIVWLGHDLRSVLIMARN
jgi:beta-lactamase regulating signal transducer with metallopeptidase domain